MKETETNTKELELSADFHYEPPELKEFEYNKYSVITGGSPDPTHDTEDPDE